MGILEKIQEIEREISRTQKNKATEYHLGLLKAKLAKYRVRKSTKLCRNFIIIIFSIRPNLLNLLKKERKVKDSMF